VQCFTSVRVLCHVSIAATQVQGRALLPGAAMIEMASSAGALLLSRTGAGAALGQTAGTLTLVGATIPAPLLLPTAGDGVLLITLAGTLGRCSVQSHSPGAVTITTHLACSCAATCATGSISTAPHAGTAPAASSVALVAEAAPPKWATGNAVAHITQMRAGQSEQYNVHPAVLDNCTQVCTKLTFGIICIQQTLLHRASMPAVLPTHAEQTLIPGGVNAGGRNIHARLDGPAGHPHTCWHRCLLCPSSSLP